MQFIQDKLFNIFKYQKLKGKNPNFINKEKKTNKNKKLINLFIKFNIKNSIKEDLKLWIKKYFIDESLKFLFKNKIIGINDIIFISILIQKNIKEFEFNPKIILIIINDIKIKVLKFIISNRIYYIFLNKFTIYYLNQT